MALELLPLPSPKTPNEIATELNFKQIKAAGGAVSGIGTTGKIPLWATASTQGDSVISQSGTAISIAGNASVGAAAAGTVLTLMGKTGVSNDYLLDTGSTVGTIVISCSSGAERFISLLNTGAGVMSLLVEGSGTFSTNLGVTGTSLLVGAVTTNATLTVATTSVNGSLIAVTNSTGSVNYTHGVGGSSGGAFPNGAWTLRDTTAGANRIIVTSSSITLGAELKLDSTNTASASVSNTVTNKVKMIVGGSTFYLLASTSAA